jgi:ankyrin repeat protein
MPSSCGVRLPLLLACALLPIAAQAQPGRRVPAKQPKESPRQADALSTAARREWFHFTTRVLGDAAVTDSMKALLASDLSPNTLDKYGRTALHAAALLGQLDLARYLLSKGADVNARDGDGRTPLMISASAGGFDHFPGLATVSPWGLIWTEPVCDLDRQGERSSPVVRGLDTWHNMVVAERPMLRLLLEAGANPSLKDSKGLDTLDHAAMGGPSGLDRLLPAKVPTGE